MATGEGKGWAKGRSAANDDRIARSAASHVGKIYQRHSAPENVKRMGYRRTLPLNWSEDMAYVVGLTATDGCLYTGLRKLNFKSADRELVATYLRTLGRTNPIKTKTTRKGGVVHLVQFW